MTDVDKDVEKGEPPHTIGGNANWCTLENSMKGPEKVKNRNKHSRNSTTGYLPQGKKINSKRVYVLSLL